MVITQGSVMWLLFAEKQRNPRSFNARFLFTRIIFVRTFFKDANFVIFSADFFTVKF